MLELQRLIPDSLVRLRGEVELDPLITRRDAALSVISKGKLGKGFVDRFRALTLPAAEPSSIAFGETITIGSPEQLTEGQHVLLEALLRDLIPWRTGPFSLFGHAIDSEWVSSIKWNRVRSMLPQIRGTRVLDVGCGNGYYMFRALAEEPDLVVGLDPVDRCLCQFMLCAAALQSSRLAFLPIGIAELKLLSGAFDLALCMGVLYHQQDPIGALHALKLALKPGGALVLETLITESESPDALCPPDRYLGMRNIGFIPSLAGLTSWFSCAGFTDFKVGSTSELSPLEQRRTRWAPDYSLAEFLDPQDPSRTIEGFPLPRRVVVYAR